MKGLRKKLFSLAIACSLLVLGSQQSALADSKEILGTIQSSLENDATIGAYDMNIVCRQGKVILSGTVGSEQAREKVVDIAKNTEGVRSVTDWLAVWPMMPDDSMKARYDYATITPGDSQIEADIVSALAADNKSLAEKISVSVNNGTATLSGNLRNFREVDQALSTTLMVNGVKSTSSQLTINGRAYRTASFTR